MLLACLSSSVFIICELKKFLERYSLKDLVKMHGPPEPARRGHVAVQATCGDRAVGSGASGGGRSKRHTLVRNVMHNL